MHSIIEKIIDEMSIQAKQKNLNLFLEKNNEVKDLIEIDEDRFRQVLINLIGNAIKYTNSGSVEVKTFNKNDNLIITIKDTGIGMNTKERERLFEKFYRVKNKKTEDVVGTGLGLWITKQIVELMKGSISVDSIEDVGTQITLEFPLI
ncbi:MAG: HAMP domain-containing sensor histidine kinase [Candidatus Pacebacteria bacterium]|nr:HAMP domain-containing sensor histidine kinase [Candidatus Paceibacterota bacterium]MDD4073942.1 HAMP domain-containing sensor histidine kinase [Candidatus Paceibacterota bacterium]